MPPKLKKGRKDRLSKSEPPEKVYNFLTLDEMKVREQKYTNRLSDLRVCLKFIDGKTYTFLLMAYNLTAFVYSSNQMHLYKLKISTSYN